MYMRKERNTRKKARSRHKNTAIYYKIGGIAVAPILIAALAFAAIAEETPKSKGDYSESATGNYSIYSLYNGNTPLTHDYNLSFVTTTAIAGSDPENYESVEENLKKSDEISDTEATECASESGLGGIQLQKMEDEKTVGMASIDLDKIFSLKNNGCFNALSNFPDLSVAIPSLGSIFSAIQKTLADYATRKVCNAVNNAIEEGLSPITTQLEKVSDSGQIDLTGRVNKTLTKKFYEVDPELGRVKTNAQTEQTIDMW